MENEEKNNEVLQAIEAKFQELEENKTAANEEKFTSVETDLKEIKDKLESNEKLSKEEGEKLSNAFNELSANVEKLSEQKDIGTHVTQKEFNDSLKIAAEIIKGQANTKTPGYVQLKTVGTMSIGTSVTSGTIPQGERESGYDNVVRQTFNVRNGSNAFGITSRTAQWVEQAGIEGSAGMTAEGSAKTQLDWTYAVAEETVKKITSYVKITEEMLNDVPGMAGEINGNLKYQIELLEETQFLEGAGTGQELNGAIAVYGNALAVTGLGATFPASTANNYDVLAAAITQIRVNGLGEGVANRIFLNPIDYFLMIHTARSSTRDYINPVTVIPNVSPMGLPNVFIWGVPCVQHDSVTAGEFLVADMTKYTIRDKTGLKIELGLDADDFTKNLVTIRGEKQLCTYARTNDTYAFVTDTFADGIAYLEVSS